jgi:hypothetical protein
MCCLTLLSLIMVESYQNGVLVVKGYLPSLLRGQENQQVNGERPGALQSAAVFLSP